jgi:hypothetical protein
MDGVVVDFSPTNPTGDFNIKIASLPFLCSAEKFEAWGAMLVDNGFRPHTCGEEVYALVHRTTWKPRPVEPGMPGVVTGFVHKDDVHKEVRLDSFHVEVDFGGVSGSLPSFDLVEKDMDAYDAAMGQVLTGSFHRADTVQVVKGEYEGRYGHVNGPHPSMSARLYVTLTNEECSAEATGCMVSLVTLKADELIAADEL